MARLLVKYSGDQLVYGALTVVWGYDVESLDAELPFKPADPTGESWTYRTDIHTAYDGTERRMSRLLKPRRVLNYTYQLDDEEVRQLRAQMRNDLTQFWKVPIWHESFKVTTAASYSGNTVGCDFTDHDIADGQLVYIDPETPGERGEFATVSGIVGSTLTITGTWEDDYAVGSRIYPAVRVRMPDALPFTRPGYGGFAHVTLNLPVVELYALGGAGASLSTYQSLTLLDVRPISRAETREQGKQGLEVVDFGAEHLVYSGASYSEFIRGQMYRLGSRSDLQYWKLFAETVVGMREPFWASTWRPDLVLDSQPSPGAGSIDVSNAPTFGDRWFDTGEHQDLSIVLSDGTVIQRRVSAEVDNGDGTSTLTLDSALPAGSYTLEMVSFLELCRLGADELRMTHQSGLGTIEIALHTVAQ